MNDVQCLIDRQLGICSRLSYDNVLRRLEVDNEESFYGLQSPNVAANFDLDQPIFACRFAETSGYEHILALANEDGKVAIQDTTSAKTTSLLESFQCHNNAVFDLAWMPGQMSFVTASGDHTACLWDVGGGAPKRAQVFSSHTRSVKCVAWVPRGGGGGAGGGGGVFATGARDGHVLVWDARAGGAALVLRPDSWLGNCHAARPRTPSSHGKRARPEPPRALSVTALAFRDPVTLLSAGECDGNIKAWDLRKTYSAHRREPLPTHAIPYCGSSARIGYTDLVVDETGTRLYASCMDDVVYCFNVSTFNALPERRYVGHENGTFYIKTCLSPDGNYLVSGSTDKNAYVWNVRGSEPVARLVGHRAEVTCAAWCRRGELKLVTCSDDARHCVWRVGRRRAASPGSPRTPRSPRARAEPVPRRAPPAPAASPPRRAPAPRLAKRCLAPALDAARALCDADAPAPAPAKRPKREEARAPLKRPLEAAAAPTADLPDFVCDGAAPHLRLMSPAKRRRGAPDWLTRLARERAPPPLSPKENLPPRRSSVSADKTPKSDSKTPKTDKKSMTLLKYFTVTNGEK